MQQKEGGVMADKQKRFADEYIIDLNATRAYKVALVCVIM